MNVPQDETTPAYLLQQGFSKTFAKRFWKYVDKNGPVPSHRPELGKCWKWTGWLNWAGYGAVEKGGRKSGRVGAHIASYLLHIGPVPEGKQINHKCDFPQCTRPDHLQAGTQLENMGEAAERKRSAYGERNGMHKLTAQQVEEIRRRYVKGIPRRGHPRSGNSQELIREFKICKQTLSEIVNGKQWKYLLSTNKTLIQSDFDFLSP